MDFLECPKLDHIRLETAMEQSERLSRLAAETEEPPPIDDRPDWNEFCAIVRTRYSAVRDRVKTICRTVAGDRFWTEAKQCLRNSTRRTLNGEAWWATCIWVEDVSDATRCFVKRVCGSSDEVEED